MQITVYISSWLWYWLWSHGGCQFNNFKQIHRKTNCE